MMRILLVILLLSIALLSHVLGAPGNHFLIETDGDVAEHNATDIDAASNKAYETMDSNLYGIDYWDPNGGNGLWRQSWKKLCSGAFTLPPTGNWGNCWGS